MSFTTFALYVLATWMLCGVVSAFAASRWGRDPFAWLFTGSVLGPIGLLLLLVRRRDALRSPRARSGAPQRSQGEGLHGQGIRLLFAADGSGSSEEAIRVAIDRLGDRIGSAVLLTVLPIEMSEAEAGGTARQQKVRDQIEQNLGTARKVIEAAGLPCTPLIRFGDPAAEILRAADEEAADLIGLGRRGRGAIARALLGSVSEAVVRTATRPVLVAG